MKKTLLVLGAWALAVLLIAVLVVSMGFSFAEALLIGVLFLPGALAARFFLSKISFKPRSEGIWNVTFVLLAILVAETALIVLANIYILRLRDIHPWDYDGFSPTLFNPVFLAGVLMLLVLGDWALKYYLEKWFPAAEEPVSFISDRHPVHPAAEGDSLHRIQRQGSSGLCNGRTPLPQQDGDYAVGKHSG